MLIADLHIHSRYSRATSRECTPEHLDLWARRKGIHILGTGDFTHPAWREELREKLSPTEEGFYILKKEHVLTDDTVSSLQQPRFVLSGEISSIYKKNGKVRKVHSLILLPSLEDAQLLSQKLEAIGNIHSDGRPILGLDCHDLLEITLETCPKAIYIPAHIWTPHFSLFGAFSGFDTIEECFGDLTPYVHALETGLSSDPPMNRRLSALDSYQLISNSDAHSPSKLGREANLLDIPLSYPSLSDAIQKGDGLVGTIEFFPEEGKYYYDGHRKCHLCLSPSQAKEYGDRCPICGRKLTIGVLHRVEELADREENFIFPDGKLFESLMPLPEIIAASTGHSSASIKTQNQYQDMLKKLGPEFSILRDIPLEDIKKTSGFLVAEGIKRLRNGLVKRSPGYDGEYGTIQILDQSEINTVDGQLSLFTPDELAEFSPKKIFAAEDFIPKLEKPKKEPQKISEDSQAQSEGLNPEQTEAVLTVKPAAAVIAGPGTGKTKTLISRILYLLQGRKVRPSEITAVTFTNKAANEMKERLESYPSIGKRSTRLITIGTFHSICYQLLLDQGTSFSIANQYETIEIATNIIHDFGLKLSSSQFLKEISLMKTGLLEKSDKLSPQIFNQYQEKLRLMNVLDFDDILLETLRLLKNEDANKILKNHFHYLLVDEFQDISPVQYQLIRTWNKSGKELFVIGDPDQSIYGFRGSDPQCFRRMKEDYPELHLIRLLQNYRSTPEIISCALSVISYNEGSPRSLEPFQKGGEPVRLVTAQTELSQAIFAAKEINRLVGGVDMLDAQSVLELPGSQRPRSFSDIAILYRTHRQAEILETCLKKEGIPYVVAGREDFLTEDAVRGTICFFRWLSNPADMLSLRLCMKLLWKMEEKDIQTFLNKIQEKQDEEADLQRDSMALSIPEEREIRPLYEPVIRLAKKYFPVTPKGKPQKLLDSWMKDMDLSGESSLKKLVNMAIFHKTMPDFLQALTFGQESDLKRGAGKSYSPDFVTLMTLHGSKGLEFPIVLLCGIQKGILPLEVGNHSVDTEEERRLFYVGMTRAREELILLSNSHPSSFLTEIPETLIHKEATKKPEVLEREQQLSLFDFFNS